MSGKGKEKVLDSGGKGKRKCSGGNDKTGGGKRRNRAVLQFLDDTAYQVDEDEDYSDFDEDDFEEEFVSDLKSKDEPRKVPDVPFVPKEEEISEEEYERIMEERYKPGAGFVTNADNDYEHKRSIDSNIYAPSAKDPAIWKVKCTVGRERYSVFCLMQKYVDMEFLGTKLPIISSFAPDHVKGFILIEADKQGDIYEACNGICSIIPSRVTAIPNNEFARLLCVRSKSSAISKGMWARVKNGKYKDDLALVVAVNDAQKKVTVKLIPRIDLKAMAEKFGGGLTPKRTAIPPQRLISSSELDELRPLIRSRRDRDTKEMVEVLDGVMLKDGYVYKKVSIDSLSFWGVVPTDDELLKFEPSKTDDSTDVQWLSQLFGEKKTEHVETVIKQDKGSGKSEGSTSASVGNNFELHDLVFFGRKDFGVVVGQEKDDGVKVIKEGSDGPSVVTVKQTDLKSASFDKKLFSALDQHSNTISINDIVRVSNGPLKDRQGIVKKIYKGILFLCDESEQNNGYICVKAQLCEKVNLSGKGSEPGPSGFADYSSSPKSPLSPDNSSQEKGHKISFQQREDDGMFSVGQSLRIRVGPLKGYLCRALAIRRSDVTVKLDSQQKILTVKSEHLSEVRGRNSTVSQGEETGSIKPCDFLATQDGASDWTSGAAVSTEGNKWNAGGSTERNSWSTLDSSNSLLSKEPGSADDNAKKGTEDSSWQIKASNESSSWAVVVGEAKQDTNQDTGGWGTSSGGWNQSTSPKAVNVGSDSSWGKAAAAAADTLIASSGDPLKDDNSWGAEAAAVADKWSSGGDASASKSVWGQSSEKQTGGAGGSQWGKSGDVKKDDDNAKGWGKADSPIKSWDNTKKAIEGAPEDHTQNDRWNKPNLVGAADSGPSWGDKKNDKSGWATSSEGKQDVGTLWNKPTEKSWGKQQESDLNKGSDKRGTSSAKSDGGNTSDGGWNMSKGSTADNNIKSPGWGGASAGNEGSGNGGGGSSWDNKVTKPHVSPKSSWKTDGNEKSSDWSAKGDWGSVSERKSPSTGGGSWKNADGGSSTGWGQGNWGKSGTSGDGNQESGWSNSKQNWSSGDGNNQDNNNSNDRGRGGRGGRGGFRGGRGRSDGNQESTWSGKSSNWGSGGGGGGFGDGNGQDGDSSGDRGRGGAGRWGRGGFQGGRGRSDFDGNRESTWSGKSNWSSGGGGFDDSSSGGGGRGGDRGGYDREGGGFRGRGGGGGFRGRGGRGGDWNNRGGDSNADINNNSWKTGSDQNSQGWKNGGGNSDGWKNSGGGSWNQTANDNNNQLKSWNSSSPKGGGGWNNNNNNNNEQSNVSPNKSPSSSWGTAPASGNSSGNWDKSDKSNEGGGPSGGSWGKGAATSSWGTGSGKW